MAAKKKDVLGQKVAEFYENHRELGKTLTVRHVTSSLPAAEHLPLPAVRFSEAGEAGTRTRQQAMPGPQIHHPSGSHDIGYSTAAGKRHQSTRKLSQRFTRHGYNISRSNIHRYLRKAWGWDCSNSTETPKLTEIYLNWIYVTSMGVSRRTCYRYVKECEACDGIPRQRKVGSGRKPTKLDGSQRNRLLQQARNKLRVSTRKLARKFGISQACVRKILKKAGVIYRKRQQVPHLTQKQVKTQEQRFRRLARQLMSADKQQAVVMDDERYFTFADDNAPGNKGFYTSGTVAEVPQKVRFWQKSKF